MTDETTSSEQTPIRRWTLLHGLVIHGPTMEAPEQVPVAEIAPIVKVLREIARKTDKWTPGANLGMVDEANQRARALLSQLEEPTR